MWNSWFCCSLRHYLGVSHHFSTFPTHGSRILLSQLAGKAQESPPSLGSISSLSAWGWSDSAAAKVNPVTREQPQGRANCLVVQFLFPSQELDSVLFAALCPALVLGWHFPALQIQNSKLGQQLCPSFACSKNWGSKAILQPGWEQLLCPARRCRQSCRTTTAGLAAANPPGRDSGSAAPTLWMQHRSLRAGRSQQSMQMSKFSLSSHPCGMQDESCPNGAHSCCFGGLRRCAPGHAGRENHTQPRFLLPWQPVHTWRKEGQHLWKLCEPCLSRRGCYRKEWGLPRQ